MFCRNCGTENGDQDKFCKNCGQPLAAEDSQQEETAGSTQQAAPDPAPVQYTAYQQTPVIEEDRPSGTAIASMVLGIVSIVFCCMNVIAVVLGIVAIVLSRREEQSGHQNGFVKAGFVCGLIGAILGGIYLIYVIAVVMFRVGKSSMMPFH